MEGGTESRGLKAQWILSPEEIQEFERQKAEHYRHFQYQTGRDDIFTQGYMQKFIEFMRKRKRQNELPFKNEKIVFYAVALFKRYYLINSYICEDLTYTQSIICCLYLSLKFNQYQDGQLLKLANKWKQKPFFQPRQGLRHFGDEGYSSAQLKFLSGIRFQTGISKIITPLESIFHQVTQAFDSHEEKFQFSTLIQRYLKKLYCHKNLMFLFDGPKIALSIIVAILMLKKIDFKLLGKPLEQLYESFVHEVEAIVVFLEEPGDEKGSYDEELKRIGKIQGFKKPLQKQFQSPRFQPQRHELLFDPE